MVRFRPRRAAAPSGPPIIPFVSRRTRRNVLGQQPRGSRPLARRRSSSGTCSSARGARKAGPLESITQRSMKFSSSRMLPGQSHFVSAFMISGEIDLFFCSCGRRASRRNNEPAEVCPLGARAKRGRNGKDPQTVVEVTSKLPFRHHSRDYGLSPPQVVYQRVWCGFQRVSRTPYPAGRAAG